MEGVAAACIVAAPGVAAARAAAVAAAAAGVAAARGGGGPQEAIRPSRWWSRIVCSGYWLCVSHVPKAAVPRNPDGEKTTKNQQLA